MAHNLSLCWIRPKGNKGHYWLTTLKGFSAAHCGVKWYQLFSFHNYLALQTYALSFYSSKNILFWSKQFWSGPKMISQYWILPFDPCLKFFRYSPIFWEWAIVWVSNANLLCRGPKSSDHTPKWQNSRLFNTQKDRTVDVSEIWKLKKKNHLFR